MAKRRKVLRVIDAPFTYAKGRGDKRYKLSCGHHVDGDFSHLVDGKMVQPKSLVCQQCAC
jgi:hypothetical protein